MIRLLVKTLNGDTVPFKCEELLSIDGKPLPEYFSTPPVDPKLKALEDRITICESMLAALLTPELDIETEPSPTEVKEETNG